MPTAVFDLDFLNLPSEISVPDRYTHAFVLIRFQGIPVGKALLPVVGGPLQGTNFRNALVKAAGWPLWERWLHGYLGWDERPSANSSPPTVTLAVCTRDRPEDLSRCLEGLSRLPDDGQEVLIIDNGSKTDAIRNLVEKYRNFRYVREERVGLNAARNRAIREAHKAIIAFTDDDAIPDPGWLRALLRNFDAPQVLCVTGLTMPLELDTEAQELFENYCSFSRGFKRVVYDDSNCNPVAAGKVGAGANMAFRRKELDAIGPFDESLDAGTFTRSGGDTEMFYRILRAGYRIAYDPAALIWHRHRRTRDELRQTLFGYGAGVYAFWTRCLLIQRELSVLRVARDWFFHYQLRAILRSLLMRSNSMPLEFLIAELRGCAYGPLAYLMSKNHGRLKGNDSVD